MSGLQAAEGLSDEQACAASRIFVGKKWPGRNDAKGQK
jgi:hypothetical protein